MLAVKTHCLNGSFKNKDDNCEATSKMYNHTCDIMDNLGASDSWKRRCPYGVKSCYWAQGKYEKQGEER